MKLAVHLKGSPKPIIISDNTENDIDKIAKQCENVFKSDKVFVLRTEHDCLIGKPSEIQSILISQKGSRDD